MSTVDILKVVLTVSDTFTSRQMAEKIGGGLRVYTALNRALHAGVLVSMGRGPAGTGGKYGQLVTQAPILYAVAPMWRGGDARSAADVINKHTAENKSKLAAKRTDLNLSPDERVIAFLRDMKKVDSVAIAILVKETNTTEYVAMRALAGFIRDKVVTHNLGVIKVNKRHMLARPVAPVAVAVSTGTSANYEELQAENIRLKAAIAQLTK